MFDFRDPRLTPWALFRHRCAASAGDDPGSQDHEKRGTFPHRLRPAVFGLGLARLKPWPSTVLPAKTLFKQNRLGRGTLESRNEKYQSFGTSSLLADKSVRPTHRHVMIFLKR